MFPVLQIGPLAIQTPGLILLVGLWIGLEVSERQALRQGWPAGRVYNLAFASLVAGVIGARLAFAAQTPAAFLKNPLGLLSLSPQMLDPGAGILVAALAAWIYIQRAGLPIWQTLDLLTGLFAVLACATGLAHLASGDAFGVESTLPWAIHLWGAKRHPTQLYEILLAITIFALTWPGRLNPVRRFITQSGGRFWTFVVLTALARIILEAFRGDSVIVFGGFRQAQLIAWLALALGLWQLEKRMVTNPRD